MKKTLLTGWFGFEQMGATAGDLMVRDIVAAWLDAAGQPFDVAAAPPFEGGVDWRTVEPADYGRVVFVCGPFGNGPPIVDFLSRFAHCQLIGLDLTMLQPLDEWNPFDLLIERDSSERARPDIAFSANTPKVPLIGVIRVHHQSEYGSRSLHDLANGAIDDWLSRRNVAQIPIDTRLDENATGFSTPEQVESVIARMDAVVTTRLHGTVLAIKNGVPALPIDPVAGGAKITRQVSTIGWPVCLSADNLSQSAFDQALDFCLSEAGQIAARKCAYRAAQAVDDIKAQFLSYVLRVT